MKKLVLIGLASAVLAGCATAPKEVNLSHKFDAAQAQSQLNGKEMLKGNAFLRQVGGGIVNCAGSTVELYPANPYSTERLFAQYPTSSWDGSVYKANVKFTPDDSRFETVKKTTTCDSEGNFEFESIKDGNYIVVTEVVWSVPSQYGMQRQGGYLLKNISVSKGHKSKVVITK